MPQVVEDNLNKRAPGALVARIVGARTGSACVRSGAVGPPVDGTGTNAIMFCDLVESTQLRVRLGEEAADRLVRDIEHALTRTVEAQRGWVVKGTGDGLLAAFHSASDALAAAVAVQQACPHPLRVGASIGDVSWRDGDCFGGPVVEASRLCSSAVASEIIVADLLRVLAHGRGDHRFERLGDLDLRGLNEPVSASRLLWERRAAEARVALPHPLRPVHGTSFVGRADELTRLEQAWTTASGGSRQFVLVAGEPGAGKTSLVFEFARRMHEREGMTVLFGAADEDMGLPYQPVVEALRGFGVDRLQDLLGEEELTSLAMLIRGLGVPPPPSDPESDRYRLFSAIADVLAKMTADEPVTWIVDDLQWSGKPTLDLLRHVLRTLPDLRLLLLGTYRTTDVATTGSFAEFLADLHRFGGVTTLRPGGLTPGEVAELIGGEHAEAIAARTGGNPYFVTELAQHVREAGGLVGLPAGVLDVVRRRLARLSIQAQAALTVGAVAGLSFRPDVVAEVVSRPVLDALAEAVTARLLDEDVGSALTYRFPHALARQAVYEQLGDTRRLQLHHDVAVAVEKCCPHPDAVLADLAYHWSKAAPLGHHRTAVAWCRKAARQAIEAVSFEDAVSHLEVAVSLAEALPPDEFGDLLVELATALDGAGRVVDAVDAAARAGDIAREHGSTELLTRSALALSGSEAMWALNRDRRVPRLVADALSVSPEGTLTHALLTAKLVALRAFTMPIAERRVLLEPVEAVALAAPTGAEVREFLIDAIWASDPLWPHEVVLRLADELASRCEAHHLRPLHHAIGARGIAALMSGDGPAFRRYHHEAMAVALRSGNRLLVASDGQTAANIPLLDGDFERAEQLRDEALSRGADLSPDMIRGNHAFVTTTICWLRGNFAPAVRAIEPLRHSIGGPNIGAAAAWIDAATGRTDDARHYFEQLGERDRAFFSATVIAASGLSALTMAACLLGDKECLHLASGLWQPRQEPVFAGAISVQAASSYYKGLIARGLRDEDKAIDLLTHSIGVHERLQAPPFIAASEAALAAITGDRALAQKALTTAERVGAWGIAHEARATVERR